MRSQGVGDIEEIYYAAIEQNGSLSLLKKEDSMAHAVIIDGRIINDNLTAIGYDEKWLQERLVEAKIRQKDIFLLTVNDDGRINQIIKDNKK